VRFVAVRGVLTEGRTLPGRGTYTCRSPECFERALSSRAFKRALRGDVIVEPGFARLYTEGSNG
jgi:predicted RNA-binding protein YlxR (DUF448 family)